jgi:hypothetical protein
MTMRAGTSSAMSATISGAAHRAAWMVTSFGILVSKQRDPNFAQDHFTFTMTAWPFRLYVTIWSWPLLSSTTRVMPLHVATP